MQAKTALSINFLVGLLQSRPSLLDINQSTMHILVIEDELKTSAYLKKGLTEHGYVVDLADNGEDGLHLATHAAYDLVILDIMLPVLDGWMVVARLRQHYPQLPIILLTARDSVNDRVKGLELGADDYLIKPFAFSELLARLRSLLRRSQIVNQDVLHIADLSIDLPRHKISRADKKIELTRIEFQLLHLLARHYGEVLSRTQIAEAVWGINFDTDSNVVDVAIRRLRKKIDEPFILKLIHSIRGMGYVIENKDD